MARAGLTGELWVFAYGSLMWRPGFTHDAAEPATLAGYNRAFCIYSTHHRGNPARPGLVLGLDRGGRCDGLAYRVPPELARATLAYLRAREQVNGVYREAHVPLRLKALPHREVQAVTFVVERAHPSYAGGLTLARQARLIRGARGISGANVDYLVNTLDHLGELAIREPRLERLLVAVGAFFGRDPAADAASGRARAAALVSCCRDDGCGARLLRKGERRRFVHRLQIDVQSGWRA
ncbi:MAG: gamma-glutamylcyclotransferase [Hyphomicrobiaceae bacterium]